MRSIDSLSLESLSGRPDALTRVSAGSGIRRHFLPDLALAGFLVTLFYCLFLFEGYQKLFRDSDAGWHIRTGEAILSEGSLPHTDTYSFTRFGQPWFAWEWGADAMTGRAYRAAGLSGVALFYALAIAAGVWLWFRWNWAVEGNFLIACLFAAPMLSTTNLHWLARPHVLSWLFLLVALIGAERISRGGFWISARGDLLAAGALTAIWANVHASFFFAPLICALYAAGHALHPLIWNLDRRSEWEKARWFGVATAVSGAASLLTPYGWRLHEHLFAYLNNGDLMARIGEFQSFNFHAEGAFQIALTMALAMLGGVLAISQKRLPHALLAGTLIFAALRTARGLPVAALALLPIANAGVTRALREADGLRPRLRSAIDSFLKYSNGLRQIDAQLNGWIWAPVFACLFFVLLRTPAIAARTGFPPDQFPVAASAAVEKLPLDAKILAPDKYGGYLICRFHGERKVFFDGRSDLYGAEFLKQYGRLTQLRPGWRRQLDEFGFTHALLPNDYSLVPALEALGWKRLYGDGTATLLARSTP